MKVRQPTSSLDEDAQSPKRSDKTKGFWGGVERLMVVMVTLSEEVEIEQGIWGKMRLESRGVGDMLTNSNVVRLCAEHSTSVEL